MRKEMSETGILPPHDSYSISTSQLSSNTQLTERSSDTAFTQTLPTYHTPSTHPDSSLAGKNFGSPFANSPDWSPTSQDIVLASLPQQTLQIRLKARFARTPGDIFNPPSVSFSRPAPHIIKSDLFEPYCIPGKGALMGDGFKPLYPGRILALRDVSAADWGRFLEDIEVAGRLTGPQRIISNVAPLTMHMGATGYFVTKAIEKGMRKKKEPAVFEALDIWQRQFFAPRGLKVYVDVRKLDLERSSSSSSSTRSCSSENESQGLSTEPWIQQHHREQGKLEDREDRKQRTAERKQRRADQKLERERTKAERKLKKKERKSKRKDEKKRSPHTLIISPSRVYID